MSERTEGKGSVYGRRTMSKKVRQAYKRRETETDGVCVREREGRRVRYIAGLSGQSTVCQI